MFGVSLNMLNMLNSSFISVHDRHTFASGYLCQFGNLKGLIDYRGYEPCYMNRRNVVQGDHNELQHDFQENIVVTITTTELRVV
jgi:hypothetical protein